MAIEGRPSGNGDGSGKEYEHLTGASGPEINFRPYRYRAEELGNVQPVVFMVGDDKSESMYRVRDTSQSGLAFFGNDHTIIRLNQEVNIRIMFDRYEAYRGRARVSSIREESGKSLIGASLLDGLLNMNAVCGIRDLRTDQESAISNINSATKTWSSVGSRPFKGVMAEYRLFLEEARNELSKIEPNIPWHVLNTEGEDPARTALKDLFRKDLVKPYVDYLTELDTLMRQVDPEDHKYLKQFARNTLSEFVWQAPLFRRSYEKPRGYAGDYVIMTYIYGRDFEGSSFFGKYAHLSAWHIPVCAGVRSRREYITSMIDKIAESRKDTGKPINILSVASGPAEEIYSLVSSPKPGQPPINLVLFDQDSEALDYCYRRLNPSLLVNKNGSIQLNYLHDSIKHLLYNDEVFEGHGPFDIIFCCGLFDYLPMKVAQRLVKKLFTNLASNGTAIIGNMAPENQSRFTMEYLAEWYLIYRNTSEVLEMADLLPAEIPTEVLTEPTGINHFLKIERPGNGV